jgi:hypothetical protein
MGLFEWIDQTVALAIVGLVIGTAQWLVLSGHLRRSAWWIPATVAAWYLGLVAGERFKPFPFPFDPVWAGAVSGAVAGILQSPILRGQALRPLLWIPVSVVASILAWIGGDYVGFVVYYENISDVDELIGYICGGAAGGLLFGVLTAPVLLRWIGRSTPGGA